MDSISLKQFNESAYEATNYMIQFFYKSGRRYTSGSTKIGMLLAITAIVAADEEIQLFWENVILHKDRGAILSGTYSLTDVALYLPYCVDDDEKPFTDEFSDDEYIPKKYRDTQYLKPYTKQLLEDVFRVFGGYSTLRLSQIIDEVVKINGMTKEDRVVLENIKRINKDQGEKHKDLFYYLEQRRSNRVTKQSMNN